MTPEERVRALPVWRGLKSIRPLHGGVSNASFIVADETGRYVARVGEDYPFHHVFRDRELRTSRAAHAIGLSPPVVYDEPGIMVVGYIDARTYTETDIRADAVRCVEILRRCHRDMPQHMTGPGAIFWVFHVLRDYAHTLNAAQHRHAGELEKWLAIAEKLEAAQVSLPIVFGHHDLLPTNFLNDGRRLWLIDWEYGAFGTAMFDLANLASNSALGRIEEDALLDVYFSRRANEALWRSFDAMKTASALREAMWGMVSELYLNAPGVDYVAYSEQFLDRFEALLAGYQERYGKL
jgi:thiamine kinase-like enzyme